MRVMFILIFNLMLRNILLENMLEFAYRALQNFNLNILLL